MTYSVKILNNEWLTHDVLQLRIEKPKSFNFKAGQAIEVTMDKPEFRGDWAPFTLTGLNSDDNLELILKVYHEHNGMTKAISKLSMGDYITITDSWNSYNNLGPGVFIAGGTGITPFIAIIRQLHAEGSIANSYLFFANKTEKDIFLYDELTHLLGNNFINILSREQNDKYHYGRIDKDFLKSHLPRHDQPVYVCGPGNFTEQVKTYLQHCDISKELINNSY